MKSLSTALKAHLALGTTTLTTCFKATLVDGTIIAATALDRDLVIDGLTYKATNGYNASDIDSAAELNVDNLELAGVLSSPAITAADIQAGLWDYAEVEIFEVNYADLTQGKNILRKGRIGDVRTGRSQFYAELRGLMQAYSRTLVELRGPACRATFGDARCKKNVADFTFAGTVTTVSADNRTITAALSHANDYFTLGLITFRSGSNDGLSMEIKQYTVGSVQLQLPMPYPVSVGDTFDIIAGCDKTLATCRDRYANVINMRAEPWLPGADRVMRVGGRQLLSQSVVVDPVTPPSDGGSTPGSTPPPWTGSEGALVGPDTSLFGTTPTFFEGFDGTVLSNQWNRGDWLNDLPANTMRVINGMLELTGDPATMFTGGDRYGYAIIDTDPSTGKGAAGGFTQKYGAFQIIAKMPKGRGYWPGFWLFNHLSNHRPEIDVFEGYPGGPFDWSIGSPPTSGRLDTTIHPNDDNGGGLVPQAPTLNSPISNGVDLSTDFHAYTLEWDDTFMKTYFDGALVHTYNDAATMTWFRSFSLYLMVQLGINYSVSGGPSTDPSITPRGWGTDGVMQVKSVSAWQYLKYGG